MPPSASRPSTQQQHDANPHQQRREAMQNEVTARVSELDADGALRMLDTLSSDWLLDDNGAPLDVFIESAFRNFKIDYTGALTDRLDQEGDYGMRALDDAIGEHEVRAIALYNRLRELDVMARPGVLDRSVKIVEMIYYAKRTVLAAAQAKLAVHQLHCDRVGPLDGDLDARLTAWAVRFRWMDAESMTPMQKLLLFLLDAAMEKRYRKQGGWCYEPVSVRGRATHAWKPVCEISAFVHSVIQKETSFEQWCNATQSMKNIPCAIEYLSSCRDYQFPDLVKQRGVYSFRNGVYLAATDEFKDAAEVPDTVVACKFFDAKLDEQYVDLNWRHIPTPHLQSILDYQHFPPEVQEWFYALMGRLLYALNQRDGWQVIPFMHGAAATGKCWARGQRVMMHDGTARAVEDVAVGDALMGDDGTPRTVLTLARGQDHLFRIVPRRGGNDDGGNDDDGNDDGGNDDGMTVTGEHVLCLRAHDWDPGAFGSSDPPLQMTVNAYAALPERVRRGLACYRVGPAAGTWTFDVEPAGRDEYFGFQVDGNQRLLMADFTVTHNSTILLKVAKNFFEAADVGVLSTNIEPTFGISAFHDKYLFVAPELMTGFRLNQGEFQSIVSGEDVQVNVKFQTAFGTKWTVPGLLAGNQVPNWTDNSGSIQRRIVLFDFEQTVVNGDMKLGDKLDAEAPLILLKCNRAYLEFSQRHGGKNIWTVLPPYFLDTRSQMAQVSSSLEAFFASTEIRLGADLFCPFDEFKGALKAFEQQNGYKVSKYTNDLFKTVFSKHGVTRSRASKEYRGRLANRDYLLGVDLVDYNGMGGSGGMGMGMGGGLAGSGTSAMLLG